MKLDKIKQSVWKLSNEHKTYAKIIVMCYIIISIIYAFAGIVALVLISKGGYIYMNDIVTDFSMLLLSMFVLIYSYNIISLSIKGIRGKPL